MKPDHRFALQVAINSVGCDVQVNGVPVVRSYSGDRLDLTLPVSDFIVPGINTLAIRAMTDRSEGGKSATQAVATLLATPYDTSEWQPLMTVRTIAVPGATGETTLEPLSSPLGPVSPQSSTYDSEILLLVAARSIQLAASIPQWGWTRATATSKTDEMRASLIEWYRNFHAALAARRTDIVNGLLGEKVNELALAHRLPPGEVAFEIGLERALANEGLRLEPVDWDGLRMELAADGHLVRLYHPRDGAVIVFVDDARLYHTFDFWLRFDERGWVITR